MRQKEQWRSELSRFITVQAREMEEPAEDERREEGIGAQSKGKNFPERESIKSCPSELVFSLQLLDKPPFLSYNRSSQV